MFLIAYQQVDTNDPILQGLIAGCNQLDTPISECDTEWVVAGVEALLSVEFTVFIDDTYFSEMADTTFVLKDQEFF